MNTSILQIAILAMTICSYVLYCPQVYRVLKTKDSDNLYLVSCILWFISSAVSIYYGFVLNDSVAMLAGVVGVLIILISLTLALYHSKCYYTLYINRGNMYSWYYNTSCGEKNIGTGSKYTPQRTQTCPFCGKQIVLRAKVIKPVKLKI